MSDRAAMQEELNQELNIGKKVQLEFKTILCSISDIERRVGMRTHTSLPTEQVTGGSHMLY